MKKNMFFKMTMAAFIVLTAQMLAASDHDDGENDKKARALNLTDLYVFKESTQLAGGSANHLVLVMNSNPRSLPSQQYYFSTSARYDFRIARMGTDKSVAATGSNDIILRFEFGAPTSAVQPVTLTIYKDGVKTVKTMTDASAPIRTTSFAGRAAPTNNAVTVDGQVLNIFAGLREDPFFFDVNAFFKFRAGTGSFTNPGVDFTANYNVNSIVVKVPIAFLQSSGDTVFDVWTAISVPTAN